MSFDFKLMSPQEVAFVRLYTTVLKQEYDLFVSTLNLMSTKSLAVKCPVKAAQAARELQSMHAEFDSALAALADRHQLRNKKVEGEFPSLDDLVKIIQLSFFKLVGPKKLSAPQDDKGWFSGHPLDWDKTWKQAHQAVAPSPIENAMTALFSALFKLLDKPSVGDDFQLGHIPGFPFKKLPPWNIDDEIEDEYYDEDEDDFQDPY